YVKSIFAITTPECLVSNQMPDLVQTTNLRGH
ncbi:MAG: hypothetical protein QOJ51_728, partial [Acidobacteriaceae bacterium]|nr:hypothetical protein [Acidobacteriaceae bacterium]